MPWLYTEHTSEGLVQKLLYTAGTKWPIPAPQPTAVGMWRGIWRDLRGHGDLLSGRALPLQHVDAWKKHSSTPFTSRVSAKLKYGWTICANLSSASGFLPCEPACLGCCELLVQESSTRLPGVPKRWISDSKKTILWIYCSHTTFYQTCYLLQGLYMYTVQTVISPFSLRNHPPDLLS